jgi:hypothetical protein
MTFNPSVANPSATDPSAIDLTADDSRAIDPSAGWDDATQAASSGPVHDFAWHRQHRSQRRVRPVDIAMIAAWAAFLGWCLFYR